MTPEMSVAIVGNALWVVIALVSVLIVPSLVVGLVVAIFQAVTQINEQTLSFLPRLLVTMLCIIVTGHWLLMKLTNLFETIFYSVPALSQ